MNGWSGRWCLCLPAWKNAASPSTVRSCRGCRANWRRALLASSMKFTGLWAKASISARRNSLAISCLAVSACRAAPRPRRDNGRPPRRCLKSSRWKATNCRARSLTGASLPSSNPPIPTPFPALCTRKRNASTHPMRWRPRRRDASPPPSRTCKIFRCAPPKGARSAPPSSRRRDTSWSRPTIARSSCACLPMSPKSRS